MSWSYSVNYGPGDSRNIDTTAFHSPDSYSNNGEWTHYTPDPTSFDITTSGAATITLTGTLSGTFAGTTGNSNGDVAFDGFSFNVTDLSAVPEPTAVALPPDLWLDVRCRHHQKILVEFALAGAVLIHRKSSGYAGRLP